MNIFFGIMTTVPAALKVTGIIDWSWTIILAPIICPLIIFALMYAMAAVFKRKTGRQTQTTRVIRKKRMNSTRKADQH